MSLYLGDFGVLGPAADPGMGRNERRYSYCALYILMIVSLACEQSSIFFFYHSREMSSRRFFCFRT